MPEQRLSFAHQDGTLGFRVAEAIYVASKGLLSLSFSCFENRRHDYMGEPLFSVHNLAMGRRLMVGQTFEINDPFDPSGRTDVPRAHVCIGEHFQPWETRLEVVDVTLNQISLRGSFVIDDPNYYDKRAKPTKAKFFAVFAKGRTNNLWAPF